MRADIHQHIWTEPLVEALAGRTRLPFIRRAHGVTMLHAAGERACVLDLAGEAPHARRALLREDGLDAALIALSSPIGIEALPREEAADLIGAHLAGVAAVGPGFHMWGPVPLEDPDPDDVDAVLGRGAVGISLPAGALAHPEVLPRYGPLLERAATREVPVFVHPGPAPGGRPGEASLTEPLWWAALTDYVAQIQAAWLTFVALGRREHPALVVVFAMLAGGAPLQAERLTARGGPPIDLRDPRIYYDVSSYGPAAIETMARRVGPRQIVYGSDRPVAEPACSGREVVLQESAGALLLGVSAPAVAA
jgi:hypothetical protein